MFPQRLEERRAWLCRGFAAAVDHALENEVHLFLQVGDLFDTPEPRNVERQFVADALARLRDAGIPALGIGGNHDTPRTRGAAAPAIPQGTYARLGGLRLLGHSVAGIEASAGGSVREIARPAIETNRLKPRLQVGDEPAREHSGPRTQDSPQSTVDSDLFDIDGVRVAVGGVAPDPSLPPGSDPLAGVEWRHDADISILLVHGSLQGHVYPGAPEPVISRGTVERLGVDCLLVGHVHGFATFQWGRTAVVVPGATERMTFGEMGSRPGFVHMELEPGRPPSIAHVPVESQPRRQIAISSAELDGDDPAAALMERIDSVAGAGTIVRVLLQGPITRQRYHQLRLRDVAEYGASRCFFLDLDSTGLYVEDNLPRLVARTGRLSPKEELIRYGEEVRDAAPPEERALIDEAMAAILEAYE